MLSTRNHRWWYKKVLELNRENIINANDTLQVFFSPRQSYSVKKGQYPCWGTWKYIKVGNSFKFGKKDFIINANMPWASTNVTADAKKFYIGENGTTLRTFIHLHKQHINQPKYRKSKHLDVCGEGIFSFFSFFRLYTDIFLQTVSP